MNEDRPVPDMEDAGVIRLLQILYALPKQQLARCKALFIEEQLSPPAEPDGPDVPPVPQD